MREFDSNSYKTLTAIKEKHKLSLDKLTLENKEIKELNKNTGNLIVWFLLIYAEKELLTKLQKIQEKLPYVTFLFLFLKHLAFI
jgi:hypothetical protein